MKRLAVNWCRTCGPGGSNFGDRLGPELLATYGVRATWAPPTTAELVTAGSVLSKFAETYGGTILGTGLIGPDQRRRFPRARALAVRGELTRQACGLPASMTLGDPGILVGRLMPDPPPRAGDGPVVIVPHYIDRTMARRHPSALLGDILGPTDELLRTIRSASLVITSSLHALIAADALGVPHVLELAETIGGMHKFRDYVSAFGETIQPAVARLTNREAMAARQAELSARYDEVAAA